MQTRLHLPNWICYPSENTILVGLDIVYIYTLQVSQPFSSNHCHFFSILRSNEVPLSQIFGPSSCNSDFPGLDSSGDDVHQSSLPSQGHQILPQRASRAGAKKVSIPPPPHPMMDLCQHYFLRTSTSMSLLRKAIERERGINYFFGTRLTFFDLFEFFSRRKWGLNLEAKTEEEKDEEKRGFDRNGFNQYRSDRIPLDRSVPDNRHSR